MTETIPHPRGDAAEPDLSPAPQGNQGGDPAPLVIYAPMRIEARAIRRGLDPASPAEVLRTGYGTTRAAQAAGQVSHRPFGPIAVVAIGMALTTDSGYAAAHSSACIPPIDPPVTDSRRWMPKESISIFCKRTMSPMVITGNDMAYGQPVAGLSDPGPVVPRHPP